MKQLGINMIAAYSPEARGRSERMFHTHQGRLPLELAKAGIKSLDQANQYLKNVYMPAFNQEFKMKQTEPGSAFVPTLGVDLDEILCEQYERTVGKDNCVQFETLNLQIPANPSRMSYNKAKVWVKRYLNKQIAIFHGPRCLARFTSDGKQIHQENNHHEAA